LQADLSTVYGIVKIVTTSLFVAFGVDRFGRKKPLLIGVALMSMFLWVSEIVPESRHVWKSGHQLTMLADHRCHLQHPSAKDRYKRPRFFCLYCYGCHDVSGQ
jgi:uncharacterized membrane protein YoaT (DUF817 family)